MRICLSPLVLLLILGAHAPEGLQYSFCVCVSEREGGSIYYVCVFFRYHEYLLHGSFIHQKQGGINIKQNHDNKQTKQQQLKSPHLENRTSHSFFIVPPLHSIGRLPLHLPLSHVTPVSAQHRPTRLNLPVIQKLIIMANN